MDFIVPDWSAPPTVRAVQTLRAGGVSTGPWASLNLGAHCGDEPDNVVRNRRLLRGALQLPTEPSWLRQVHGCAVAPAAADRPAPEADASFALERGPVCAVLTADCLPVLLCDRAGTVVAAVHAGWRGLLDGVIEQAVRALPRRPAELLAWMGAAIGPLSFEVGAEVFDAFVARDPLAAQCFKPGAPGKLLADLYGLAGQRLRAAGVASVAGGGRCTYREQASFFSFRRDGQCGRMATLIWLA